MDSSDAPPYAYQLARQHARLRGLQALRTAPHSLVRRARDTPRPSGNGIQTNTAAETPKRLGKFSDLPRIQFPLPGKNFGHDTLRANFRQVGLP